MRRRWAMAVAAAAALLTLTACFPAQQRADAIEDSLRDLPGVSDVYVSSREGGINQTPLATASVEMDPSSTAKDVTAVVEAWYARSEGEGIGHSLSIDIGDIDHTLYIDRSDIPLDRLTAYAVQWRTLVPQSEVVIASVGTDASFTTIEWPAAATPVAMGPAVDGIRDIIAGVEAPGGWMITSNSETGADQVFVVISDELPTDEQLSSIELLDTGFGAAQQIGEVAVTVTLGDDTAQVDVDLTPDEFRTTPGSQVTDQLLTSSVWPVIQQFTSAAVQTRVSTLTISVLGSPVAVLDVASCERPATERFPLDFEVWDYWASINTVCFQ